MVRVSNSILAVFNVISGLIGVAAIAFGLYFYVHGHTGCAKGIQNPLLITGAVLFVVSLLGLIGSCGRINFVLFIYLFVMFLLIVGLIIFTIFTFLITNDSAGKVGSLTKITDFRHWLDNQFTNEKKWGDVKNCLIDTNICQIGDVTDDKRVRDFYQKNLSPTQAGCCQPPKSCGFTQENATFRVAPKTGGGAKDKDCKTWSNKQDTLCYNCESCKAGFVESIKKKWRQLAIFNLCITVMTIMVYSIGCCVRKNNKGGKNYVRYRPYP